MRDGATMKLLEVELAQLTPFQRQLLGARLCLKIAWSYPRRWLVDARYGVRRSWILLQWAMFWSWFRVRRINSSFLIFTAAEWQRRRSFYITLKRSSYAALQLTRSNCNEMLRYAAKRYSELTVGISARLRKTVSGALEAGPEWQKLSRDYEVDLIDCGERHNLLAKLREIFDWFEAQLSEIEAKLPDD